MPISTATVLMRDPSLRRLPYPESGETKKEVKKQLREYKEIQCQATQDMGQDYAAVPSPSKCYLAQVIEGTSRNIPLFPLLRYTLITRLQLVRRNVTGVTSSYTATLTLPTTSLVVAPTLTLKTFTIQMAVFFLLTSNLLVPL